MFKVGDRVVSLEFGPGVVYSLRHDSDYPVLVEFDRKDFYGDNISEDFTAYGRKLKEANPTLFHEGCVKLLVREKPTTFEGWVHVYPAGFGISVFNDEEAAREISASNTTIIDTIKITYQVNTSDQFKEVEL